MVRFLVRFGCDLGCDFWVRFGCDFGLAICGFCLDLFAINNLACKIVCVSVAEHQLAAFFECGFRAEISICQAAFEACDSKRLQ